MPLVLRPPGTRPLPERLADLGRARRLARTLAGLFALAAGLTLFVLLACLLDGAVGLPALPRAGLLAGLLAAAGVGWVRLVRAATREPVAPLAVALQLENRLPRLNDALASAVEFLERGESGRFQSVAAMRAENLTERLNLSRTVPAGRAWAGFWLLVAASLSAFGVAVVSPPRTAAAVARLFDPFGVHPWPTRTTVTLLDPPMLLAAGDPYPLRFTVNGVVPEMAVIHIQPLAGPASDEPVAVPDGGEVSRAIDPGRVSRDFQVKVTAGDGDSGWTRVEVAAPPRLVPAGDRPSPQVRLTFPAYTSLPSADLPDGTGVVEAVCGTVVTLTAAADREIVSAALVPQFDRRPAETAAAVAAFGATTPFGVVAADLLGVAFTADLPVSCDGRRLSAEVVPPLAGLYALRFTDARGLTGTRLIDFRLFPDPPPVVSLDRPTADRDALDLLPSASLPLATVAEDRTYAVRWLRLEYRTGPNEPFRALPLADAELAGDVWPALGGGTAGPFRPAVMAAGRTLPVAAFRKPDGSAPANGDTVTLRTAAADWDDRTALKEPGRSREVVLRVADRKSLEAKVQQELAAMRPELLRLREALRAGLTQPPTPAGQAAVEQAARDVRAKLDDPSAGLTARADRLTRVQKANDLPASPTTDKADAAAAGTKATSDALDPTAADKTGLAAAEAELGKLLEKLEQWGGAGEVRGEARALKDQVNRAGQSADADTPAERAAAGEQLDRAAEQAAGLVGKAGRLAVEKEAQAASERAAGNAAKADQLAAEADALRRAVRAAGGDAVADDLKQAADELRKKRPGESASARKQASDRLDKLADRLGEPPATSAAAAERLTADQDELRKKATAAADTPDPERRAEQLRRLAPEQKQLKDDADRLAERLTREKKPEAAAAAKAAAEQLAAAGEQLDRGQNPDQPQQQADRELDKLKEQTDPPKPPDAEKLNREKQRELADLLRGLRDRQAAAVAEAERLSAAAATAKRWDRPTLASLADLEDRETALAAEVRPLTEKELADLPVFAKLAGQAADAMTLAGKRAAARRDDLLLADDADPAADERFLTPMRVALRKLDQLLAAVAPDPADKPKPTGDAPPPMPMPMGDAPPPGGPPGVSPLAQLKALRAMQADVAEQTDAFARTHPDPDKLTPDDKAELASLEQAQRDVKELFAKLAALLRGPEDQ